MSPKKERRATRSNVPSQRLTGPNPILVTELEARIKLLASFTEHVRLFITKLENQVAELDVKLACDTPN